MVGSLLGVLCAHPPGSECFAANGSSLPPSDGTPWTLEPLCHAESRESYPQVLYPHYQSPKPGTDRHGRLFTSRGAHGWGCNLHSTTPPATRVGEAFHPKSHSCSVPCLSPSCILHILTGCSQEHYFNRSFILKSFVHGLLLGEPKPRQ